MEVTREEKDGGGEGWRNKCLMTGSTKHTLDLAGDGREVRGQTKQETLTLKGDGLPGYASPDGG